jgi:hypothetical protein
MHLLHYLACLSKSGYSDSLGTLRLFASAKAGRRTCSSTGFITVFRSLKQVDARPLQIPAKEAATALPPQQVGMVGLEGLRYSAG